MNITLSKWQSALLHFAVPIVGIGIASFFGAHPDLAQMTLATAVAAAWNYIQGRLTTDQSA